LENAARPKHQTSAPAAPMKHALLPCFAGLFRFAKIAAGGKNGLDKVTPRPVAELWSSFRPSDNGGSYRRLQETRIVGSPWNCEQIAAANSVVEPPPFGVAEIDNAIVCGEGIICRKTSDGIFAVSETLINATTARSILPLRKDQDKSLYVDASFCRRKLPPDTAYAFLRQVSDNNYGHWLVEGLPKVAILAEHFDISSLKFIVTRHLPTRQSAAMRKVYLDSLAAFGIEPKQIVPMAREAVQIERLLYPLPLAVHPWVKAPRVIQILEDLRDKIGAGRRGPKRIYASRAFARKRRLRNETEILRILKDFDVAVVYPERHSFVDQVRLFADAELLVGNNGANLANAVFAPRGVRIFAVASEAMRDDFFWDLAELKSGGYFSLHGKATDPNPDMNSDFRIDPVAFRSMLEEACGTTRGPR
jgi:capsular polysaccharide biosynthesis protein